MAEFGELIPPTKQMIVIDLEEFNPNNMSWKPAFSVKFNIDKKASLDIQSVNFFLILIFFCCLSPGLPNSICIQNFDVNPLHLRSLRQNRKGRFSLHDKDLFERKTQYLHLWPI